MQLQSHGAAARMDEKRKESEKNPDARNEIKQKDVMREPERSNAEERKNNEKEGKEEKKEEKEREQTKLPIRSPCAQRAHLSLSSHVLTLLEADPRPVRFREARAKPKNQKKQKKGREKKHDLQNQRRRSKCTPSQN